MIVSRLGGGGSGDVYLAHDRVAHRRVALKLLSRLARSSGGRARLRCEAAIVSHLCHPGIVAVYDAGLDAEPPYVVMEYVDGRDLRRTLDLEGGPVALPVAVALVASALDAVSWAHEHGVVHGDVKPENLLVPRRHGTVARLTDFGMARMRGGSRGGAIAPRGGTAAYMSPEQALGHSADERSDLYACGLLLYELVCGRLPFEADVPAAFLYQHVFRPVPPPSRFASDLPDCLERLILRLLEKAPAARPQTAREVMVELARFRSQPLDQGPEATEV